MPAIRDWTWTYHTSTSRTSITIPMPSYPAIKKMSYVGEIKNGVVIFELLDLPKIINVGQQYECELELFIGNQYFVPFMAVFEFIEPMEIKASLINGNFVKKNETEQEVPKIAVKMEKAVSENLKKIDSIDSSKLKKSGKNKRMRFVVLR